MVPPQDPNSNFGLAQGALLAYVPIPPAHVHRVRTETGGASTVAAAYEAELREFFALTTSEEPRFDLVLLGLGADGHVASLFPGSPTLQETRRLAMPSPPGRLPPAVDRVTLTLPVLNRARAIVFLVSGSEKASVLSHVLGGDTDLPAGRVNPVGGVLRWFVDEAAMGGAAGIAG
jgi:6-phosphogluconolactonase